MAGFSARHISLPNNCVHNFLVDHEPPRGKVPSLCEDHAGALPPVRTVTVTSVPAGRAAGGHFRSTQLFAGLAGARTVAGTCQVQ